MLHLYAQPFNHADAYIVGDKESLAELILLLQKALVSDVAAQTALSSDGEGYVLFAKCLDDNDPQWLQLSLPYTDSPIAHTFSSLHPVDLVGTEMYRRLHRSLK